MNYNIVGLLLRVSAGAVHRFVFLTEGSYKHALKLSRPL
jgi:hypothetical protein